MEVFCKSFSKKEKTTTLSILVQIELPGFYYFFDLFPSLFFFFFKPTHPQLTMEPRFIKQRQKENKQKTNQPTTKNVTLPHNIPKCEMILVAATAQKQTIITY